MPVVKKLIKNLLSPLLRFINENRRTAAGLATIFIAKSVFEYSYGMLLTGIRVPGKVYAATEPMIFYSVILVQLFFSVFIIIALLCKSCRKSEF
jgi:hypothetical protein